MADRTDKVFSGAFEHVQTHFDLSKHLTNFDIASTIKLLPLDVDLFDRLRRSIRGFGNTGSAAITPRHRFSELGLTRANFWAKIFTHQSVFDEVSGQMESAFLASSPPRLLAFGI